MIGRKGRLGRVIYMTNIGTIPDKTSVKVKVGDNVIGTIEEAFLERLRPKDIFVLGGSVYQFKYSKGMTCQVNASVFSPPTIPSWYSEMLPLNFDLAVEIGKLRRLIEDKLNSGKDKEEVVKILGEQAVKKPSGESEENLGYRWYNISKRCFCVF